MEIILRMVDLHLFPRSGSDLRCVGLRSDACSKLSFHFEIMHAVIEYIAPLSLTGPVVRYFAQISKINERPCVAPISKSQYGYDDVIPLGQFHRQQFRPL